MESELLKQVAKAIVETAPEGQVAKRVKIFEEVKDTLARYIRETLNEKNSK